MSAADLPTEANAGAVGKKRGPRADRPTRRTFTAENKAVILAEYEALTEPGARGALRTVEAHMNHIMRKLGVSSRAQVVVWSLTHGAQAR